MSDTGLLDGLNEQQRAAVTAGEGPVLVLAGPGSGKTRVLTHRIAYLIQNMGVSPYNLMAVTFTNKAANEMRTRVEKLLAGSPRGLQIGTFHAICARLLRREADYLPYGSDFVIYDTDDQEVVVSQAVTAENIDSKKFSPRRILGAISNAKNELVKPEDYRGMDYFGEIVARVYPRYQQMLRDNNAMDFDDLLMQMVILMQANEEVRSRYQSRFDFVLVDEFQDTNTAQYTLVQLFGAPRQNIFVVGDEDQAIYAFRGADYRNVMQFRADYPDAAVVLLEQNYRSTQTVLDVARAIIDKNANRTPKALFTQRGDGDKLTVRECYNEQAEAQFITETILELTRDGFLHSDIAIMYRTNAQSRVLEEGFIHEGIPYKLVGGVGFYKRREVRDLLSYLRLIHNPNDSVSFSRIINVPKRGLGKKSVVDFQKWVADEGITYHDAFDTLVAGGNSPLSGRSLKSFTEFALLMQQWRQLALENDPVELFDAIVSDIGYSLYLHDISDTPEQAIDRNENVRELRGLMIQTKEAGIPLGEFLAEQALVADVDSLDENADAVTLMTLHAAKGLEYPVVFIPGLEEGMLPHSRSLDELDGMDEERRLMYVGITRAEDRLYLSYAFRRMTWGTSSTNIPSRFLTDVPVHLVDSMPPTVLTRLDRESFRQQITWEPSTRSASRLAQDLQSGSVQRNEKVRSKIVPFPGTESQDDTPLRFTRNMKVRHAVYGDGMVIDSKRQDQDEEVTVVFANKKYGIKRLLASFANMTILED